MKVPEIGLYAGSFAIGLAVVLFGPKVLTVTGPVLESVAKTGIKGGLKMYERGRQLLKETRNDFEGIAAEAKQKMEKGKKAPAKKRAISGQGSISLD